MISFSYAFREFGRRPGRSLLSLMSIVIAVAAIVAVTSATATTRSAYRQVFEALAGRADLEVVARGGSSFKQSIADPVRDVPGIRNVVPAFRRATILYAHGKKAKALAVGVLADEPESLSGYELASGRLPAAADEIAIETNLARAFELNVGDEARLLTSRSVRPQPHKVSGLLTLDSAVRLQQGGMIIAPLDRLQRAFKAVGEVDGLHLYLEDPKSAPAVIAAATKLLPEELEVRVPSSRSGLAEETLLLTEVSLNLASALSFTTAVFIALSVFLMNVSERRRQLAMLRAVGATRRQVVGMVCREALLMGITGTVMGIPIGIYGGGFLIRSMAAVLQANLPETPNLYWAVPIGAILGPVICLIAAWYPAHKASRVSPLEGMRPVVTNERSRARRGTTATGIAGLIVTAGLTVGCIRGDLPIWAAVIGTLVSLISLVLLLPVALHPVVKLLGRPFAKLSGVEGEMSERLVLRHGGRSALTAGVLFIAVAASIGTSNAVFSITDDIRTWYERTITADFLMRAMMPDMTGQEMVSMPESLRGEIAALDGVEKVEGIRFSRVEAEGQDAVLVAREFRLYDQVPLDIINADSSQVLEHLRQGEAVVGSVLAERIGIHPGDTLHVTMGTESHAFRVVALATEYTFGGSVVYVDRGAAERLYHIEGTNSFLIKTARNKVGELEPRLRALADDNGLLLQSFAELMRIVDSMVAGVTGGLWVLLALGLLVGALGVVNTLSMNVLEQTRELGMLRAIGMRRSQVVKTVLGQAALIGVVGVVGGSVSGLVLARMINFSLGSMFGHYVPFSVRPEFVALLLAASLTVVMVSALVPARRAAGLNAIEAMRHD